VLVVCLNGFVGKVYFKGRRDGPLEAHLYAASLSEAADPNVCVRLTDSGFSHFCSVGKNVFVDLKSSLTHAPDLQFFRLVFDKAGSLPRAEHVGKALEIRGIDMESPFAFSAPRLFTIQSNGFDLHGVTYFPPKYDPSQKYPTVIYTYGGPSVQLVENTYTLTRGWSSQGLVWVLIFLVVPQVFAVLDGSCWRRSDSWCLCWTTAAVRVAVSSFRESCTRKWELSNSKIRFCSELLISAV
jgi:hypothetical protein